jgi:beta-galactosidase/beta-glucuronidase
MQRFNKTNVGRTLLSDCWQKRSSSPRIAFVRQEFKKGRGVLPTLSLLIVLAFALGHGNAQSLRDSYGPYSGVFRLGGNGLSKAVDAGEPALQAASSWSLSCWFQTSESYAGGTLIAGLGNPLDGYSRYLGIRAGKLVFWMGKDNDLSAQTPMANKEWHFAAAIFDGTSVHLFSDGQEVAVGKPTLGRVDPQLLMAPDELPWTSAQHFGGQIAYLSLLRASLSSDEIQKLAAHPPDFSLIQFEEGSKSWPIQTREQAGYRAPQDPSTLPHGTASFSAPMAQTLPPAHTTLKARGANEWALEGGWKLASAPRVQAEGPAISQVGFNAKDWWPATVPGTVLTTMVDRGVYPDPDYGLNNLAIPEGLNKQNYWYRAEFRAPKAKHFTLTLNGINYSAVVWLNGKRLGDIKGAFIRGSFEVTNGLRAGEMNALAVRVSPPPHPGIPQEQSIKGGPGENGGTMVLDGPTFMATEGWDWIPAIRDRNTGLWQDVVLSTTSDVRIGDAQVVTSLPLPDTSHAFVEIDVPLTNLSSTSVESTLTASFDEISVTKRIKLALGENIVKLTPKEFGQLLVQHPRLWWPNGYGKPNLYKLKLSVGSIGGVSDTKELTFGIREITYELSLYDSAGRLRRVEVSPTTARQSNERIIDVTHEGMRQVPHGWVASLVAGESSPAVKSEEQIPGSTDLIIKVNGVRIACRGGNWGMDDSRKRVSREHLEPFFRLYRDVNLNMIRNWVGQNTEETFYQLADEYGQLVWNDFWATTQDYNVEPQDPDLFLKNARDTVLRFRNHPSIALWCGRNEGVPQPVLNEGLADLLEKFDGTRYYSASSNRVNLRDSGPYKYQQPETYYQINHGFSVELGVPSPPTLEALRAWIPKEDLWPISDTWAYHDWHHAGNGDVAPFMQEIETEFGAATDLEDFDRKAQMLSYVEHRAIFEGFNAHLWSPNSGRLLWMTQPAWPSSSWQILSSDYDTQGSFYGVKKACEPIHVQLDLTDYKIDVINTTGGAMADATVSAKVYSLDSKLLFENGQKLQLSANALTSAFKLDLAPILSTGMVFVRLALSDAAGQIISRNLYWLGESNSSYRELNRLPAVPLTASATATREGDEIRVHVQLENRGAAPALASKLTLKNASDGSRVLPAYASDNYVSLLAGESQVVDILYPAKLGDRQVKLEIRGWNLPTTSVPISF